MTTIVREVKELWSKKCIAVGVPLMMFLSYCTLLWNPTIGIDDTSFKLYYVDGVSPAMGRWCLYMINKLLPLDYNPVFVEAVGLLCFCISITLWCLVFYRVFGEKLPALAYMIFGGVMLSSPIISEVVIWYLQDGIYLGYGMTALAVLFAMDSLHPDNLPWKKRIKKLLASALFLTVALGFYESFMIVFLMAVVMVFLGLHLVQDAPYVKKPLCWIVNLAVIGGCAMVFRTIAIEGIIAVYDLEEQTKVLATRDAGDILASLGAWFDGSRSGEDFAYVCKDYIVKYFCNAVVYKPVLIFAAATGVFVLWSLIRSLREKNGWIVLSMIGILVLPLILPVVEGVATYYRSCQYIPLFTAFVVLLMAWELRTVKVQAVKTVAFVIALSLLYHQGYEMNKWLYVDAMKYEYDKQMLGEVALDIIEQCDEEKPVCVIGSYELPAGVIERIYCPDWSGRYILVKQMTDLFAPEIFEKYDTPYGYASAETPQLSFVNWGRQAYYGFDRELVKFWKMHGFTFEEDGNGDHYVLAEEMMKDAPCWPEVGSIVEMEDHIIVKLGNE